MNKRLLTSVILVSILLAAAVPAMAAPRMQSYIDPSTYMNKVGFPFPPSMEQYSWITEETSFTYRAVGYWSACDNLPAPPPENYDQMDVYVVIGVPKGQNGTITINGTDVDFMHTNVNETLTGADFGQTHPTDAAGLLPDPSLYNHELMDSSDYAMVYLGRVDNDSADAYHYDHGIIGEPGWGGEIDVQVTVSGFGWVHFDAVGFGIEDRLTYVNPYSHDASYHGPATVVPEPGTLSLLGVGLLGLVPILRRKRR